MPPETEHVPRPEFEMLCKNVNGSLSRIETTMATINGKLDLLTEADNLRVTWDAYDRHQIEVKEAIDKVQGRPSWAIATIIGFLSTGFATTLTLLLTKVIH